jgi:hypothetical protein
MNITRPEPGSLYDIIQRHARHPVYLPPSRWTDLHSRLLQVDFVKRPAIVKPVPTSCGWLTPSGEAETLIKQTPQLTSPKGTRGFNA